jgi:hypothetical protein
MAKRKPFIGLEDMPDFDESWTPSSTLRVVIGEPTEDHPDGEPRIVAIPNEDSKAYELLHGYGFVLEDVLVKNLIEIDGGSLAIVETTPTLEDHYCLQLEMEGVVEGMCISAHRNIKYGDDSERST